MNPKLRNEVRCLDADQLVPGERQLPDAKLERCSDEPTAKFFGVLDPPGDAPDVSNLANTSDVDTPSNGPDVDTPSNGPDATTPGSLTGSWGCQLSRSSPLTAPSGLIVLGLFALLLALTRRRRQPTT